MYMYDLLAIILIGIAHVSLYVELIRYNRLSYPMVITLSVVFIILLGIVVTVTGYPEFNFLMIVFLLSLGLMQIELPFFQNLYFALASTITITLVRMVLIELGLAIVMWTPLNFYLSTLSIVHFIAAIIITGSVWLLRKPIQKFAQYIVQSPLYYLTYAVLVVGLFVEIILTSPTTPFLAMLHQQYGYFSYALALIIFLLLLLMVLIGSHLTKEKLIKDQQEQLDNELIDYVEKLEVMHDELARFRHDYLNILSSLDEGVRTKNIKQIEQVYDEVIAPTSKLMNNHELDIVKLSNIRISEVKSVISVKVTEAQQHGIQVMLDIPHPIEYVAIPMVDFIRMISIIIENASEEAAHSKDKIIQLAFFEVEEKQYFIVRNTSDRKKIDLQQIYEKGHSSKKGNEGYGLYSLKHLADQNEVTLETIFKAPFFTQTLILKRDKK